MITSSIRTTIKTLSSVALAMALVGGCADDAATDGDTDHEHDDHGHDHDHEETEIITTVILDFTPQGGGDSIQVRFDDPDGDGGVSGTADPLVLTAGTTYDLSVGFSNGLVDPPEDIGEEVAEEAEEHQLFVTGTGVSGPAAGDDPGALVVHAYADVESDYGPNEGDDLPVGLTNTITAAMAGAGTFEVRLQHLPELNGAAQKTAGLAESLAAGEALPGDVDAAVTFELTVQ
ncbi:MAG: hypothetical protein AB1Z98_20345 [Nannocystaceae bacterium]